MKDRLTTAPLPLDRPQGYFVLFVGRRYYLRWREVSFLGVPKELCSNGERRNDGALHFDYRNLLAKSIPTNASAKVLLLTLFLEAL